MSTNWPKYCPTAPCTCPVPLLSSPRRLDPVSLVSVRVSRQLCEDGPLLEEQETEGQRQLHSLLLQQLHTGVDIDR